VSQGLKLGGGGGRLPGWFCMYCLRMVALYTKYDLACQKKNGFVCLRRVSLCVCISLFLALHLCLCLCLCLSLCLCRSVCLSVCVSLPVSLSVSLCLCLSVCVSLSVSLCQCLSAISQGLDSSIFEKKCTLTRATTSLRESLENNTRMERYRRGSCRDFSPLSRFWMSASLLSELWSWKQRRKL